MSFSSLLSIPFQKRAEYSLFFFQTHFGREVVDRRRQWQRARIKTNKGMRRRRRRKRNESSFLSAGFSGGKTKGLAEKIRFSNDYSSFQQGRNLKFYIRVTHQKGLLERNANISHKKQCDNG